MEIPAIIQDDVQRFVGAALRYSGWVLDRVDPIRRLTDVVVLVRTPPRRHRQALTHDADRIAEDLTVLLARDRQRWLP